MGILGVIPAGGTGRRMGPSWHGRNKILAPIFGKSLLARALEKTRAHCGATLVLTAQNSAAPFAMTALDGVQEVPCAGNGIGRDMGFALQGVDHRGVFYHDADVALSIADIEQGLSVFLTGKSVFFLSPWNLAPTHIQFAQDEGLYRPLPTGEAGALCWAGAAFFAKDFADHLCQDSLETRDDFDESVQRTMLKFQNKIAYCVLRRRWFCLHNEQDLQTLEDPFVRDMLCE